MNTSKPDDEAGRQPALREDLWHQQTQAQTIEDVKALADFKAALDQHTIVAVTNARGKILTAGASRTTNSFYSLKTTQMMRPSPSAP